MNINRMRRYNQIKQGQKVLRGWKSMGLLSEESTQALRCEMSRTIGTRPIFTSSHR